jgi:hypothetical protein
MIAMLAIAVTTAVASYLMAVFVAALTPPRR